MHDMNDININHINCDVSIKFYRRKDLTVETRLYIAFMALLCNKWGLITRMAKQYAISRTFIYMLQSQLNTAVEDYFYPGSAPSKKELTIKGKEKSLEYALLLRLEGKCSIPSISDILEKMGLANNSVGTISQTLSEIGRYLPNTLEIDNDATLYVYLAADEMFSHSIPILILSIP